MTLLFTIVAVAIGMGILFKLLNSDSNLEYERKKRNEAGYLFPQEIRKEFFVKTQLMTRSEQALFFELKKQLPHGYYIFPNMRVADILITNHGDGYYKRRNKLLPKHIDFVIANNAFKPVVAIELNGHSHSGYRQQQSDEIKTAVFQNAGLPLDVIRVGEVYSDAVGAIFRKRLPDYQ